MSSTRESSLRTIDLRAVGERSETTWCSVPGCPHATSNHKPFCLAHLDRLAYVSKIRRELASRDEGARDEIVRLVAVQPQLKRAI